MTANREDLVALNIFHHLEKRVGEIAETSRIIGNPQDYDWVIYTPWTSGEHIPPPKITGMELAIQAGKPSHMESSKIASSSYIQATPRLTHLDVSFHSFSCRRSFENPVSERYSISFENSSSAGLSLSSNLSLLAFRILKRIT